MIQTAIKKTDFITYKTVPEEPVKTYPASRSIGIKGLVCPDCGAEMYAKSNNLGTCFYSLYPGGKHTDPICQALASKTGTKLKSITHEAFNPKTFLDGIIPEEPLPPKSKGTARQKKKIIDDPGDEDEDKDIDLEKIRTSPSSTIRDLIKEKLYKDDPRLVIDNNNTILKEILLAVPSFKDFFGNPEQLSNTRRIIQMAPYNSFSDGKYYIGNIYKYVGKEAESNKKIYTYIFFKINIRDSRKPFSNYFWKTFRREPNMDGKMRNVSNYENIFVAGNWKKTDPYKTKKGQYYPMFETTVYDFGKQIYHFNKK